MHTIKAHPINVHGCISLYLVTNLWNEIEKDLMMALEFPDPCGPGAQLSLCLCLSTCLKGDLEFCNHKNPN